MRGRVALWIRCATTGLTEPRREQIFPLLGRFTTAWSGRELLPPVLPRRRTRTARADGHEHRTRSERRRRTLADCHEHPFEQLVMERSPVDSGPGLGGMFRLELRDGSEFPERAVRVATDAAATPGQNAFGKG